MITIYNSDGILTKTDKEEANILLASSNISDNERDRISKLIALCIAIDNFNGGIDFDNTSILQDLISFDKTRLLSPLTLSDNEFELDDCDEIGDYYNNKRYPWVRKHISEGLGIINKTYINHRAFIISPKNTYNHNDNKQINNSESFISPIDAIVYITKGGIVVGEYIKKCYIKDNTPKDILHNPIELNVSIIYHDNYAIYTIDNRDPNLNKLRDLYDVRILIHDSVEHYNIRKYEKIIK